MKQVISSINYLKLFKFALGSIGAFAVAMIIGLDYAPSAGIITLLTITDTRKETLLITLKRLIIFIVMTILSILIFPIAGYNVFGFALIMIPYLFFCLLLNMNEAIAMVAVLCTHYLSSNSCSLSMILNEFLLLLIGAGIGVLLNWFMPSNIKKIRDRQREIDTRLLGILHRMSIYLLREDKSDYNGSCFQETENLLTDLQKESLQYIGNHFHTSHDYFLRYMKMRTMQCEILKRIYHDIMRIQWIPRQAAPLSDYFESISREFSEVNDVAKLLERLDQLFEYYRQESLPQNRLEFENRALLYHMLYDLQTMIQLKYDFTSGLSNAEKQKYWQE